MNTLLGWGKWFTKGKCKCRHLEKTRDWITKFKYVPNFWMRSGSGKGRQHLQHLLWSIGLWKCLLHRLEYSDFDIFTWLVSLVPFYRFSERYDHWSRACCVINLVLHLSYFFTWQIWGTRSLGPLGKKFFLRYHVKVSEYHPPFVWQTRTRTCRNSVFLYHLKWMFMTSFTIQTKYFLKAHIVHYPLTQWTLTHYMLQADLLSLAQLYNV